MDTVLGVSMAPTAVRAVLLEGENAEGATVDEDNFEIFPDGEPPTVAASHQVVSAILGTREGAAEAGYRLCSTGVACRDQTQAAALRDALAARKVEHVMLVSAFLAAAALAQTVGNATGYDHTALLYIEPDTAKLAVVDTADGSIADVHHERLPDDDDEAVAKLTEMIAGAEGFAEHPDGVVVVGSGVDIPLIKPALEAATSLPVNVPDEPETALARGAALASASAPLFASSTAALAYAKDPGTGEMDASAVSTGVAAVIAPGEQPLAYSAVPDEEADASTAAAAEKGFLPHGFRRIRADHGQQARTPFLLPGSVLAAVLIAGTVALVTVLAIAIRPTLSQPPNPAQNLVTPTKQAPALAPAPAPIAPPAPPAPEAQVPAPAPTPEAQVPAPTPAPEAQVPAPAPVAPAPAPAPVAPAPAPAPVAPAPAPVPVAPIPAPPPLPVPPIIVPLPPIFGPPAPPIFGPPAPGHGRGRGHGHGPWLED